MYYSHWEIHCGPGPTTAKCVALCVWTQGNVRNQNSSKGEDDQVLYECTFGVDKNESQF